MTSIGDYAFRDCSALTSIVFPSSVASIGTSAFYRCTALASVTIPEGVKSIGVWAFKGCTGMTSIVIPKSVTTIDEYAFQNCDNLGRVYYSGTYDQWEAIEVNDTGDGNVALFSAVLHCEIPAPTLRLPASLTTIEEDAFLGIDAQAVWIPSTVKHINGDPFADSGVQYIYGVPGSTAYSFAMTHVYDFVPCTD